jgi:succinate dehydrogenase hydrophobic anchor subunit
LNRASGVRVVIAAVIAILLLLASVAGSYVLALWAIGNSQRQWCDTLTIITADAHPTTANSIQFYAKLHDLEKRFGCT